MFGQVTCRGVAYWEASEPAAGAACQKRILYGTKDSELWALDADTGEPCADFGEAGKVALRDLPAIFEANQEK